MKTHPTPPKPLVQSADGWMSHGTAQTVILRLPIPNSYTESDSDQLQVTHPRFEQVPTVCWTGITGRKNAVSETTRITPIIATPLYRKRTNPVGSPITYLLHD